MDPSPSEPVHPFYGRRKIGRYELLTPLASGGMGTVFAARTTGIGGFERLVAIKVLHPHMAQEAQFIGMFLDEARLAARIRHPNVVSVLDVGEGGNDGYFLVMDYVEGVNLGVLLSKAKRAEERLLPSVAFRIVMDALSGLSAAHRLKDKKGQPLNIVHRDVSPQNVLVGVDGVARLTDFGIAKAEERLTETHHGSFKGKAAYASPEQVEGDELDQRSDLFSVGIVLWEALTGRRLFRGDDRRSISNKVLNARIQPPSEVDAALAPFDELVLKALDRDPAGRFQSAVELLEAAEDAAGTEVAAHRRVAEVVRRLADEKLESEHLRINEAAESVGLVIEREGEHTSIKSRDSERPTVAESPRATSRPRGRRRRPPLGMLMLVLVLSSLVGWLGVRALKTGAESGPGSPDAGSLREAGADSGALVAPPGAGGADAGEPAAGDAEVGASADAGDGPGAAGASMQTVGMHGGAGMQGGAGMRGAANRDAGRSPFEIRPNPYLR